MDQIFTIFGLPSPAAAVDHQTVPEECAEMAARALDKTYLPNLTQENVTSVAFASIMDRSC